MGRWQKRTTAACAAEYPDHLEFFGGTYRGTRGEGQRFVVWDAGIYQVVAPDQVRIGTATDELVSYRFTVMPTLLTFIDQAGCTFEYERAAAPP